MEVITRERLQELFDTNGTYKAIIEVLGMDPNAGGGYRTLKAYIKQYHVDLTKFEELKVLSNKAHYAKLDKRNVKYTVDNVFCKQDIKVGGDTLRRLMLLSGKFTYECSECRVCDTYNDKPITLQIDHIDGDSLNNIETNLRFMCPNCHSQTITYGSKNRKGKKVRGKTRAEYWVERNGEIVEQNRELAEAVRASSIDLTKRGWSAKVSNIINRPHQKVATWMRKHMPEEYATQCAKRKNPVK